MKISKLVILLLLPSLCYGFDWGKTEKQKCEEAKDLVVKQLKVDSDRIAPEIMRKVEKLCPSGSALEFVRGLQAETDHDLAQAYERYAKAVALDEQFAEARGRQGLLQAKRKENEQAITSLAQAIEEGARNSSYRLVLADLLLEQKSYSLALYHLQQAQKQKWINLSCKKAQALAGLAKWNESYDSYKECLALTPMSVPLLEGYADVILRLARIDEAVVVLKKAIEKEPARSDLHRKLADAYAAKGDQRAAEAELQAAGIAVPTQVEKLVKEGDTLFLKREYPSAIRIYLDAARQGGDTADILQKLGDAFAAIGNDDEALKNYQKALNLQPDDSNTIYSLAVILERRGDLDGAVKRYQRVIELDQTNGDARRRLADIHTMRGNITQAISEYQTILSTYPDNPIIYFKMARACEKAKKYPEAIKALEAAIRLNPSNVEIRKEMAQIQSRLGKYELAEIQYREILRIDNSNESGRFGLINMLSKQKHYDQLGQVLTEETVRFPNDANCFYRLGVLKEYLKDFDAAITAFKQANTISETARTYKALARVYLRVSDRTNAREALQMAQKLDPEGREAKDMLDVIGQEEKASSRKRSHSHTAGSSTKKKSKKREKSGMRKRKT